MTLREALANQGNQEDVIDDIIAEMCRLLNEGTPPDVVLEDYGLEPDYVLDLLDEWV